MSHVLCHFIYLFVEYSSLYLIPRNFFKRHAYNNLNSVDMLSPVWYECICIFLDEKTIYTINKRRFNVWKMFATMYQLCFNVLIVTELVNKNKENACIIRKLQMISQ